MVSELATNCIRHTDSGFELTITRAGATSALRRPTARAGTPEMRSPKPTDPSGRGLKIIDMLSARRGASRAAGKTVWFTVADTAPASAAQASRA